MKKQKTREVNIAGKINIGGNNPIAIQSMTNTYNKNIEASVKQIIDIYQAGAKLVRLTLPTANDLQYIEQIKTILHTKGFGNIPLIADIHFSPKVALKAVDLFDKIRINPGNFAETKQTANIKQHIISNLQSLIEKLSLQGKALRVGVNHGSLSDRMLNQYGDTERGMVESAMEYLEILSSLGFYNTIVSLKATKPSVVVYANRLFTKEMKKRGKAYPLHLGVTEAGYGIDGRIKSAIGIGTLLAEGIGDTIRVSLTEPPEKEISPAQKIMNYATQLLETSTLIKYYQPTEHERFNKHNIKDFFPNNKPVVIIPKSNETIDESLTPDYKFNKNKIIDSTNNFIVHDLHNYKKNSNLKFLKLKAQDFDYNTVKLIDSNTILILDFSEGNSVELAQKVFKNIMEWNFTQPYIFYKTYDDTDYETFYIKASIDAGYHFINGFGNGMMIYNSNFSANDNLRIMYGILQATGSRINFTEYIVCPSCGRTLFDIEKTAKEIEKRTNHLKGIKIAVMGCIVNGLGEMADADYGYVGTKPGMVSLYKNKKLIKENVPQNKAVNELINIIKQFGDWTEE